MQLGCIPPSSRLLAMPNAFCRIKSYHPPSCTTTRIPDMLAVLNKSHSISRIRYSFSWIVKAHLRLPCYREGWILMCSSHIFSHHRKLANKFDKRSQKKLFESRQSYRNSLRIRTAKTLWRTSFLHFYQSWRRIEKGFQSIYWNHSHQHGWKKNSRWGILLQNRTVDVAYIVLWMYSLHATPPFLTSPDQSPTL